MKSVTFIDDELAINHPALASTIKGAWARTLARLMGGTERGWDRSINLSGVGWYWNELSSAGANGKPIPPEIDAWHARRERVIDAWLTNARHEMPSLPEVAVSRDGLRALEREVARECSWGVRRDILAAMKSLVQDGRNFAIISQDASSSLLEALMGVKDFSFPVIGPEELGRVGLDGMSWETLCNIAGAEPATSRFITTMDIEGWPIRHPFYYYAWKLFLQLKHTYEFRHDGKREMRRSKDRAATEQALAQLTEYTGQDFGTDLKAWTVWLRSLYKNSKQQWLTLLRDDTQERP